MEIIIEKKFHLTGHYASVYALTEGREENTIYSGSSDKTIAQWDISEGKPLEALAKMTNAIYKLVYLKEMNKLFVGSGIGHIHVLDLEQNKEIKNLIVHPKAVVFEILYHPKYACIISAGADGYIKAFNINNFELFSQIQITDKKIRSLAIAPDGNYVVATCGDGYIKVLSLPKLQVIHQFFGHNLSANKVVFHPTKPLLLTGGRDAYLNITEWPSAKVLDRIPAHNYALYDIVFNPENTLFATASRDKTIKIWNAENMQLLYRIDKEKNKGHINSVNKLLWTNSANTLVSTGDDRSIIGWQIHYSKTNYEAI